MSSRPPLAHLATDLLARDTPVGRPEDAVDVRGIEALREVIEAEARKRRTRRRLARGAILLAAGIVCAIGWSHFARPRAPAVASIPNAGTSGSVTAVGHAVAGGIVFLHEGRAVSLEGGAPLAAHDRLVAAADGRASIALSTGSHLALEGAADLTVLEQGSSQVYSLRAGSLRADVTKLRAGERFMVRTGDADIEVRGTSFHVAVVAPVPSCGGGTSTRVAVAEGTVVVRTSQGEDRVHAGEEWPRGCMGSTLPPAVSPVPAPTKPVRALDPGSPTSLPSAAPPASSAAEPPYALQYAPSEVAAQNRLFSEATAARRAGDTKSAIAAYERFLSRYPSSNLAEGATVERMRLLATIDRPRATHAAQAYLASFPSGFAREEARTLMVVKP